MGSMGPTDMRITHFRIENYRGLRLAEMANLSEKSLTLLTGKNGTGKSLVLEAITAVWSGDINLPEFVGPYGYSLKVEIGIALEEHEYNLVDEWRGARELPPVEREMEHVLEAVSTSRESTGMYTQRDQLIETLQNPLFSREHPFASIDLLSARRQVSLTTTTSVDLALLDRTATAEQRRMMYEQEIRWKTAMQMPDIGAYLTSLDYRDYVTQRDGVAAENEYAKLQDIFFRASGKKISLPTYDPASTKSSIQVALPAGQTHSLEDLSNGEREMLGMLYYVSQLSALGGVLLLDEPEKHLHPTLQLAVLKAMMAIASRGQMLVVTHSLGLISSSPSENVVVVRPAWETAGNQLQRVSDLDDHAEVLADLGLARRELFQANYLLVVEGPDDEKRLRMLLPDEIAAARVVVAGGRHSVLRTADALRGLNVGVPWICVIDRDFLTDDECESVAADERVFIWDSRMLENILLHPVLLREILLPALGDGEDFDTVLLGVINSLKPAAIDQFVEARIMWHDPPTVELEGDSEAFDKIERQLHSQIEVWSYRLGAYREVRTDVAADIEAGWDSNWRFYVDGKRVFAELQRRYPVFKNVQMLVDTLMVRIREKAESAPEDVLRLQGVLRSLQEARPPVPWEPSQASVRDEAVRNAVAGASSAHPELNTDGPHGPMYGC